MQKSHVLATSQEAFIEKANIRHKFRYGYEKVNYVNSMTKIEILCHAHGYFFQNPNSHLAGRGCAICAESKKGHTQRLTIEDFIKRARAVHGDKYDYSVAIYINTMTKLEIKCIIDNHGSFFQCPNSHISQKSGCPKCKGITLHNHQRSNLEDFIKKAVKRHGEKYSYTVSIYVNNTTPLEVICFSHGSFWIKPVRHTDSGVGCPKCSCKRTQEEAIEIFMNKHLGKYDYSKFTYEKILKKSIIICPVDEHGEFLQHFASHAAGQGCPKCVIGNVTSKIENEWLDTLTISHRQFRIPNTRILVDGYDVVTNTVYQFHGDFWHGNPDIYKAQDINPRTKEKYGDAYLRTQNTDQRIRELGYNLVIMWENDWLKLKRGIL